MAAMMAPPPAAAAGSSFLLVPHPMQHQRPMAGILLNGYSSSPASSVQNSPRRHSYYLPVPSSAFSPPGENRRTGAGPSSISSHSSSSSSSSDDITSSSAQSGSDSQSTSISRGGARKIRFAPLPDPRRDVFVAEDGSEIPASEVFADGASQEGSQTIPCSSAAVSTPTPSSSGFPNFLHPTSSVGSLGLYGDDALSISGQSVSTITGGGSATYLPLEKMNSRNSACSASAPSSPKRNRWSRLLRLPKKASGSKLSPDFSSSLFRTSSRDSSNSTIDDDSEKKLGAMERRQSTGSVGFSAQESRNAFRMGLPLTPIISESGTSSTRPSTAPSSNSPFGSNPSARRGTRLLNGRVYGSGARSGNPFKHVKDQEPEFVEWGHGGMGSVQANSGHGSEWARLQSNKKLSVGHAEGQSEDGVGEDDGSGMGWVKRRREQREKERKEREAREKAEGREGKGDAAGTEARAGAAETPAITIRSASPLTGAGEEDVLGGDRAEEASTGADAKQFTETTAATAITPAQAKDGTTQQQQPHHAEASPEHIYTAVKIPAHLPKHHHFHRERDQLHRSASAGSSHVNTPVSEHPSTSILGNVASSSTSSSATMPALGGATHGPSPLSDSVFVDEPVGAGATESLESPGALSVSSSSSTEDSDSEDEMEREEDEDDDEDEEVLDEDEEARKTALCAGVEKVSKHKE